MIISFLKGKKKQKKKKKICIKGDFFPVNRIFRKKKMFLAHFKTNSIWNPTKMYLHMPNIITKIQ